MSHELLSRIWSYSASKVSLCWIITDVVQPQVLLAESGRYVDRRKDRHK